MNGVLDRARQLRDELPRLIQPSQADFDRVRMLTEIETLQAEKQQARADALREAVGMAKGHVSHHPALDARSFAIASAIERLIDQPQEDVCCEWVHYKNVSMVGSHCGVLFTHIPTDGKCLNCGKPIKVKE